MKDSGYTPDGIRKIDKNEYPDKHDPLVNYESLTSQDIQSCLQKSDIFISNLGRNCQSNADLKRHLKSLYAQLTRYYAVALRPGLVTPTRDERCMQIAFVAKSNSGCISRQVGAAVADEGYAIKAIGRNDVPKGQVPCVLRNVGSLLENSEETSFSDFELKDDELRQYLENKHEHRESKLKDKGLPCPFCFKDAINATKFKPANAAKGDNQVHTRSLHAEENAFLQLTAGNGANIKRGKLFTTASPCELCSKKAYQLGIKDIVYIDPYPGISIDQILQSGPTELKPIVRLFSGAVGKAYHRLYEPMLPVKDEIMARLKAGIRIDEISAATVPT